jgi:IPT/TIG domain
MTQTYPLPFPGDASASAISDRPRYGVAGAADWAGGAYGDDIDTATAIVALASASGAAAAADYAPRHQAGRAALPGASPPNAIAGEPDFVLATDIGRRRGSIAPQQPYPKAGDAALAAPVITSLAPNTIAAGSQPLLCKITGTGFSVWSTIHVGVGTQAAALARFVSPTEMWVDINPLYSVPGTTQVTVKDHGVTSAPSIFTFT